MNNDENAAKYYDIVFEEWTGQKITQNELNLVRSLLKKRGSVIDIGCGTGRHIIPLYKAGYDVLGVEPLITMINLLKAKNSSVPVINDTILNAQITNTYDLVTMFWNTIAQLAYSFDEALEVFRKIYKITNADGKVLIDSQIFEPVSYTHLTLPTT